LNTQIQACQGFSESRLKLALEEELGGVLSLGKNNVLK
jgi:hypothetical protein